MVPIIRECKREWSATPVECGANLIVYWPLSINTRGGSARSSQPEQFESFTCMQRKCAAHSCVRSSIYRSVPLNQATRLSYIDLRTSNNSLSARTKHWQTTNLSDSETDSVDILFVIFFCAVGNTCRSQLNWVLKITVFSCFWLFSKLPCFPSNWNGLKCSVLLINAGNDLESLIVTKSTSNQ